MKIKFIFDLDGTLTKKETLKEIAKHFNIEGKINPLTEKAIKGEIPYIENFIKRVEILKVYPINEIQKVLKSIKLSKLVEFINKNPSLCAIATTNIDEWIKELIKDINCEIYTSKATTKNNKIEKLTKILKKEEIVKKYQERGYKVVFIGDGHNDLEAMRIADISIACGCLHNPANSLFEIVDYLVYDENRLIYFLHQILGKKNDLSVVMPVAGIGSRLGLMQTKVLLKVENKSILEYHLNNFKNIKDLRLVIGFQAKEVIKETLKIRNDILFVYNHKFFETKTGYSFYLGSKFANEYVIEWDGDLIVNKKDVEKLLSAKEYVAGSKVKSENPVFLKVKNNKVIEFSFENGEFEWSGPACIKQEKVFKETNNVLDIFKKYLPIDFIEIDAMDFDTYEDYLNIKRYFDE